MGVQATTCGEFFDPSTCTVYQSLITHDKLFCTEKGAYVIYNASRVGEDEEGDMYQTPESYNMVDETKAYKWLVINGHIDDVPEDWVKNNAI